jgi:hypothetical protein
MDVKSFLQGNNIEIGQILGDWYGNLFFLLLNRIYYDTCFYLCNNLSN